MYGDKLSELLVGKRVKGLRFDGRNCLTLETSEGLLHFHFAGDCCSQSYVTDILGVEQFLDKGEITSVEESDYGDREAEYSGDHIERHGLRLRCKNGDSLGNPPELLILWENSSNGYYDGSIQESESPGENEVQITKNWNLVEKRD